MQRVTGRNSLTEVILSKLGQEPDSSKGATIDTDNLYTFLTPEQEGYADYERSRKYRKPVNKPVDSAARKRLKHACSEYYRRLEALRSYIAVNREAFRKITKKFDKMSGLGMSTRFMNNQINKSYFGGMENKLDQLINGTELLVAKYFWENNRRRAAAKLRTRGNKSGYHSSFLRSGIYLGMSLIFLYDAVFLVGGHALFPILRVLCTSRNPIHSFCTNLFKQIYLFFCLYAQAWRSPSKCDSDSVKLWGILGALPTFWRFVQCFRRWADSGQWFPHFLNAIKYGLILLTAMSLNLWRTEKNNSVYQTTYIGLAFVSSGFALFWDVVMDWSLMNPYAPYPLLRDELFFKMPWLYYFAIVFNTVMRFTWVLFIFLKSLDRWGPLVSFCIAFGEILRRFVWCILRMENEHKGNVQAMRAYRDPKLPYQFHENDEPAPTPISPAMQEPYAVPMIELSTVIHGDLETGAQEPAMKLSKSTMHRLGRTLTTAHRKDYERKTRIVEDEGDVEDVALANKSSNTV
ncbi:EXS family-domain-containing protein [Trichophaea hybrida]|nr:EXS family-domain-containing protein [Trichophaea hybrida]